MSAVLAAAAPPPLVGPDFLSDPYPTYRAWRDAGPIHWSTEFAGGAWIVTRHADIDRVLRDPAFSARRTAGWVQHDSPAGRRRRQRFQELFARAMLFLDAPDHGRIRGVLQAAFRPAALAGIATTIENVLDDLLGAVDGLPQFDFMQAIARPLPARVIASLMGLEDMPEEELTRWSEDLATFIGAMDPSSEQAERAQEALFAMLRFLQPELEKRRAAPGDDLLSRLIQAESKGVVSAGPELLAQCVMLLFAGFETTRNLLGNGLHALLSHRAQWERLRDAPELMPAAVRELLRFDSPVQYTGRRVAVETVLHGHVLRRGDLVLAMIASGNRDPVVYERPDELDIARQGKGPLSFGAGPHVCIGAALTSMEAQAVLRRLIRRWPDLELATALPAWNGNAVYRGLSRLIVCTGRGEELSPGREERRTGLQDLSALVRG
jgi:cytochrome P450